MSMIISLLLLSFLSDFTILSIAQAPFQELRYSNCFDDAGNYTNPSTYRSNLNSLLSDLTSDTKIEYGFYNVSLGEDPDRVSAIGLCRGDVKTEECRNCLNNASNLLLGLCPNQKQVMGGFDECMLAYSNRSILGDDEFSMWMWNYYNASNAENVRAAFLSSMNKLIGEAASGDSRRKFAASNESGPILQTLYAAVQCTPDLSDKQCSDCLVMATNKGLECCGLKRGGRVIKFSCNLRYEDYLFYDPTNINVPKPSSPPPSTSPQGKGDTGLHKIFVIVVPIVVIVTLFGLGGYFLWRTRRKRDQAMLEENFGEESSNLESLRFNFATIETATNKFSSENRIGKGGFGEVYKGILPNGQEIAVKRLSKNSVQGTLEFKNEVLLIAKLQHRNLVTLQGFCLGDQEKILIYEYVPNKSIDYFLFDSQKRREFDWSQRFKVLGGIARGLLYLHEHSRLKIIHRDLKPSNILLDNNMNPKISDFGMARIVAIDQDQANTNRIVGTYGYMSPEYAIHGEFSEKSDVFSYGVIILEIISGRRNTFSQGSHSILLSHAWRQWNYETPLEILDPFLIESCSQNEAIKCVQIGLLCVQDSPDDRPTMTEIVSYLSNLSIELPFPKEPTMFIHGRENPKMAAISSSSGQSSQISKPSSVNEISESEFLPR